MGGPTAERALQPSESASLFASMPEEIHIWDLVYDAAGEIETWRLVDANPAALSAWGRRIEDVRGRLADEIFGPGSTARHMPMVRKVMAEGVARTYEDFVPQVRKYLRFTTIPLGRGFITTASDITVLETERRALDAILEAAPVGIIVTDETGKVRRINPAGESMWGPAATVLEHYPERKGWWADGSERDGQPVESDEWPLARARRGDSSRRDELEPGDPNRAARPT